MKPTLRRINRKKPNKKRELSIKGKSTEEEGKSRYEFNKLSDDVLTSIFMSFPEKTLSMSRCVSKSWNEFISSPSFFYSHQKQSMENAQLLFLETKGPSRSNKCTIRFFSIDMEGRGESNEVYTVTISDRYLPCCNWHISSGLVCLSTGYHVYLCNPVMQQLCELPKGSFTFFPQRDHIGFGYLSSKKEYKVVRFFYRKPVPRVGGLLYCAELKCEVFTINCDGGTSNEWKETAEMPPYRLAGTGHFVNEIMYWVINPLCLLPHTERDLLVSLDFENETFLTISRPSSFETRHCLSLIDLKGMLCLPDLDRMHKTSILDMWILKDNTSSFWVKEYSINLVSFGAIDRGFTRLFWAWNEEIIFRHFTTVYFYDLRRKHFREVKGVPMLLSYGIYWKSLFSLGRI